MSQVVKHICDKCNKEIVNSVDSGRIYLGYYNSLASSKVFEADFCNECILKMIPALKRVLKDMFKDTDEAIIELDTFFSRESALIEQLKEIEEEEANAAAEDKDDFDLEVNEDPMEE